ncbi:MAG TPA: fluoride efflux transporter CrcB [Noviherbaspirillum sp.]|nr:fluoride efflux transporter CrcB [Noviherbaspirillum sp.]
MNWLAIGVGAALGAWLRWALALWLNSVHSTLPHGTLAANLAGGFMVGIAVAFFSVHEGLPIAWRLFVVTGFLGGLTTFSTFSAESLLLLQRGDVLWAFAHSALHLFGSLAMCAAGFALYRALA